MAADRIYIRCSVCGESVAILCMPASGGLENASAHDRCTDGTFGDWLELHVKHNELGKSPNWLMDFGMASQWFTLETESNPFQEL